MASKEASVPARRKSGSDASIRSAYLVLYNFVSAVLWTAILGRVVLLVPLVGTQKVYGGVGNFAKWTQTLALLEILHALSGLVRASVTTTLMQVASRLFLVWGIVDQFPHSTSRSPAYSSMLIAWSVTEVVRYTYLALKLRGWVPQILTWLRYNLFFILYPMGASSESWLVYKAIQPAGKRRQELEWALRTVLLIYIPGFYVLYTHMIAQRRKVLSGADKDKKK